MVRSWSGAEVALAVEESNVAEKLRAEFGTPSNFKVSREELACHSGKLVELLKILERQRARREEIDLPKEKNLKKALKLKFFQLSWPPVLTLSLYILYWLVG